MKRAPKLFPRLLVTLCLSIAWAMAPVAARSEDKAANPPIAAPNSARTDGEKDKYRNFYEVLEDIMGDFEYDLRNGEVQGLKDLSMRNVAVSENVPPSFKSHLELLVTERILKTTRTRMIQCLACKSKRSTVNGDSVVITSAENNQAELSRIAKTAGISHFMDVAFSYQPAGMVLSMYVSEPDGGTIIWSRSYNSETTRAAAFRRGVDYSQADDARKMTEYQPGTQHRITVYYVFTPNIGSTVTGNIGLAYRLVERYDNRKKEVGFEAMYQVDAGALINSTGVTAATNLYLLGFNLTLLFVHSFNFIGEEENFNKIRGGLNVGVGGTYTAGYLGGLIRAQWDWRMAKRAAVVFTLGYRPTSTAFFSGSTVGQVSGFEYGLGISTMF